MKDEGIEASGHQAIEWEASVARSSGCWPWHPEEGGTTGCKRVSLSGSGVVA